MMSRLFVCFVICLCVICGCASTPESKAPLETHEPDTSSQSTSNLTAKQAELRASLKQNTGIMPSIAERERRAAVEKEAQNSWFSQANQLNFNQPSNSNDSPNQLFRPENQVRFSQPLSFSTPKSGARLRYSSNIPIRVYSSRRNDIRSVLFYVNGKVIHRTSTYPYRCTWYSRDRGNVNIRVEARLFQGGTLSESVQVVVDEKNSYRQRKEPQKNLKPLEKNINQ